MELKDLKAGQKIYDMDNQSVKWYTYLCVHPTGNGAYHILIDACEDPFRIYGTKLKAILDKNLNSYKEAQLALADKLEQYAKDLRDKE